MERGKQECPEKKNSRSREENQKQIQPTYDVESGNPGHIGGRRVLLPLRHPCSP